MLCIHLDYLSLHMNNDTNNFSLKKMIQIFFIEKILSKQKVHKSMCMNDEVTMNDMNML